MHKKFLIVVLIVLGIIVGGGFSTTKAQPKGMYLKGIEGPYRGRVIDAETKKPLVGAVVVAVWYHQIAMIIQTNTVLYKAREALTDKNGEFVINAEDIERNAPSLTLRPTFKIFLPGYGAFPRFGQTTPRASGDDVFEGAGSEVELPRLKAGTDRLANYRELNPYEISNDPFTEVPNFMRLKNEEARNLGLEPYRPRENK